MLKELMEIVELIRKGTLNSQHGMNDDHFTLMGFTTHWKAGFFTPNLDNGTGRDEVRSMKGFSTPEEAIIHAIRVKLESGAL